MSTGDNLLHFVAKNHLAEKAEEILLLGYQSLLEQPATDGNDWPLFYAVQNKDWRMVKIFMEALNPK